MLVHRQQKHEQGGFTLVELLISIVIISVLSSTFLVFFKSSFFNYLNLQSDATNMTQLNTQAMRVATVIRGATNLNSVDANDLSMYGYFYPSDAYVSLVHYYVRTTGRITQVLADVTPLSANPPTGTLLTSKAKTYTIIDNYYQPQNGSLFTYLDAGGNSLALPVTDLQTIKTIRVNLATKASNGSNQVLNVQVGLRNRKTNL